MPLKHRWTKSGKAKQKADERAAWEALRDALEAGSPTRAQVQGIGTWAGTTCTNYDSHDPNYGQWKYAHKYLTQRARRDRQREQHALANGGAVVGGVPARVRTGLVQRATLRLVLLTTRTLESYGGGTMLQTTVTGKTPGQEKKATTAKLVAHLEDVLKKVNDALLDPVAHQEDHDLRAVGHAPLQVLLGTEWYFRPKGRAHTQAERNAILTELETLSHRYPEWVIAPGSIFWTPDAATVPPGIKRVFNQAPVYYGGEQVALRTKRESHDIDHDVGYEQRWGPDCPASGIAVPGAITAASQNHCTFTIRGKIFCLEICRDHSVADAAAGFLAAGQPGAHIYLFTSNGTVVNPGFIPAQNNGIMAFVDGSGGGSRSFQRVTRANPLTHNWTGGVHPLTTFRNAFGPERNHVAQCFFALDEIERIERENDPDFATFMTRFNAVFPNPVTGSTDGTLQGHVDTVVTPLLTGNAQFGTQQKKGLRIQALLGQGPFGAFAHTGSLPTGTAITAGEQTAVTPYAQALVDTAAQDDLANATKAGTRASQSTAANGFAVTLTGPGAAGAAATEIAVHGAPYDLHLYNLVDL